MSVVRLVDIFVLEGFESLLRAALGLLTLLQPSLIQAASAAAIATAFTALSARCTDADVLIRAGFGERYTTFGQYVVATGLRLPAVAALSKVQAHSIDAAMYYIPKVDPPSNFVTEEQFEQLWLWLPANVAGHDATRLFSTNVHGCRLATLFKLCEKLDESEPSLLLVKVPTVCTHSVCGVTDGCAFTENGYALRSSSPRSAVKVLPRASEHNGDALFAGR
jgi:hypothetical protein